MLSARSFLGSSAFPRVVKKLTFVYSRKEENYRQEKDLINQLFDVIAMKCSQAKQVVPLGVWMRCLVTGLRPGGAGRGG